MKVYIDKDWFGIHGSMPSDRDIIDNLKPGTYLCEIKRPRNIKFHKKFFALMNLAYSMQEEYKTMKSFRQAVTIKAGYCDISQIVIPELGEVNVCRPKSISFANMDESEFDIFYEDVLRTLVEHFCPGTTEEEIIEAVLKYLSFGG